jgi:hypothetical protein
VVNLDAPETIDALTPEGEGVGGGVGVGTGEGTAGGDDELHPAADNNKNTASAILKLISRSPYSSGVRRKSVARGRHIRFTMKIAEEQARDELRDSGTLSSAVTRDGPLFAIPRRMSSALHWARRGERS